MQYLQRTKASPIDLARKRFPRPTANELNDYISNTISFLIVREPFERLLSAYRNKLEGCRNKYYKLLGEQIVKKFRKAHPPKGVVSVFKSLLLNLLSKWVRLMLCCAIYRNHPTGRRFASFSSFSSATTGRAAGSTNTGARCTRSVRPAASTLR